MSTAARTGSPRILVVRLSALGDVIHALAAAASLKHSFPGSHLTWLVAPRWALLLDGNPFVDAVIQLDRTTVSGLWRARRDLRRERFDFAVDFQGLIQSALAASLARVDRVFGFDRTSVRETAAALFYSNVVRPSSKHVVDRNLDLAHAAGAGSILRVFPLPPGRPEGELPEGDFVLASPLAGWKAKQWPVENYGRLAARVSGELGMPLVINTPPGPSPPVPGTLANAGGLAGLIHATRRACAVVGVDSGPLHLAAALGKPGVAIFGPTDPERNGPYGGTIAALRSPRAATTYARGAQIDPSMRDVSPDAVFEALYSRLRAHRDAVSQALR
ncbi:MAG: glycosyltransferase family 9 protein [Bryobacteraceae bacterium]